MAEEEILTPKQREDIGEFAGVPQPNELTDEELLTRAADLIGLTGELAVDPEGMLELERDDLLAVLGTVPDDDAHEVEHPELLHFALYVRPASEELRRELENADLLDPAGGESAAEEDGWSWAWWGDICTRLPREADLPTQLQALHRALAEAETVIEQRDIGDFFERMQWLDNEAVSGP